MPEVFPITTIKINIHFIGNEFYPGQPGDNNVFNGNKLANDVVMKLNEYMADILPNPIQTANFVGDSRIRYELYSEAAQENDVYQGVWYWDNASDLVSVYGNDVMKITIWPTGVGGTVSGVLGCMNGIAAPCISVYHTSKRIITYGGTTSGYNEHAYVARVVAHEIGHATGLCHSFTADNPCADVNALAECGGSVAGVPGACLGDANASCLDSISASNNIMSYRENKRALTPCQWRTSYRFLFVERPNWVRVENGNCSNLPPLVGSPYVVPSGANEIWDELRFVFDDVIIETGATLTINCQALLAPGRSIAVRRGAKLIVENGEISNLYNGQAWGTIFVEGNSTMPQPNPLSTFLPMANQAGVVYLDGAVISGAGTAISTSRQGEHYNPLYWGGVVYAQNSKFIHNRRAVEFMQFRNFDSLTGVRTANRSAFIDCIFSKDNSSYSNTVGVTIWGCDGIRFEQCFFLDFDVAGVYGIDYGIHVLNNSTFRNCYRGIEVFTTRPIAGRRVTVENSLFEHTSITVLNREGSMHIYAESTNELEGLFVFNNNRFEDGKRGILVSGPAQVNIVKNSFNDISLPAITLEGGGLNNFNEVRCNTFRNAPTLDVSLRGPNPNFTAKYNDFQSNALLGHLRLVHLNGLVGEIDRFQGSILDPARNCFAKPLAIRALPGESASFTYYAQPLSGCPHTTPVNNLSDGGSNNYEVEPIDENALVIPVDCSFSPPASAPELTEEDLLAADAALNQALSNLVAQPASSAYEITYQKSRQNRQQVLTSLLRGQRARGQYALMEEVLLAESSEQASRWLLGVYLESEQWQKAQAKLLTLPQTTPDQQAFRTIMSINLALLAEGPGAELDSLQEAQLYTLAESQIPSRSYARSLLALYRDVRFPFDELEFMDHTQMLAQPLAPPPVFMRLHPNPTRDWLYLHFSSQEAGQPVFFYLADLNGRQLEQQQVDAVADVHVLDLGQYPTGIYFLRIQIGNQLTEIHKIIKP